MVSPIQSVLMGAQPTDQSFGLANQLQGLRMGNEQIANAQQNRQAQAQQMQMRQQQVSKEEQLQGLYFVNDMAKKLKSAGTQQERDALLQPYIPMMKQSGFDINMVRSMTPEMLDGVIAQTDAAITGMTGRQGQAMTAGQRETESMVQSLIGATNPETGRPFTEQEARRAVALRKSGITARAGTTTAEERIATDTGLTEQVAESKATIAQRKKFAEMTGASRSKTIDEGFEKIQGIDKNIRNIDDAIAALDSGANTGAVESKFFPSIKAASIRLDQVRNELALDVIGAVTFGALSEGELELAKETALPTRLQEGELKDYLKRKKEAQQKLKAYYEEQIDFLDQGGTIAQFVRMKRRGVAQSPTAGAGQSAAPSPSESVVDWGSL